MPLTAGSRLGPYEIVGALGAGGMGEVYRAHDTKLGRDVAIKILPEALAADPERIARFQREAKTLAAVNHPNIAHIYGLEESASMRALVMELVEGPTLADRIAQSPIPLDDALPIARQIAEALEAAHEQGIIHRDLKPANIKLRPDGTVKVLDFGLAKAVESAIASGTDLTASPTITSPAMTRMGVILGTAAYMAPEQARGRAVDKRADVWAFGCVLFEMLSGARTFDGDDIAETIGAVIHKEPAWNTLPGTTPKRVRLVLERCLERDPKRRLRDVGDVRLALDGAFDAAAPSSDVAPPRSRSTNRRSLMLGAIAGGAFAAVIGTMAWWALRPAPTRVQPVRFSLVPSSAQPLNLQGFFRQIAISPDGTHIAYIAGVESQLMIRGIDELDAVPLRGATGGFPFFSPDGRWIGYFTGASGELKRSSLLGGPPVTICRFQGTPRGATWGADNTIIFATNDTNTGLMSVSSAGGEPKILTKPDPARGEQDHLMPSLAPDARTVFFTISSASGVENAQIAVLDLRTARITPLIRGGTDAAYLGASTEEPGYLMYASFGKLLAVRFDIARLSVLGDPVPVVEEVATMSTGATDYSVSHQGTLVYVPGSSSPIRAARSLVWVSRDGKQESLGVPPRPYTSARLSPDETRAAVAISDQENDIWIYDLARKTMTRLTSDPNLDSTPIWSLDGLRVFFTSNRAGSSNIYSQAADGSGAADRLTTSANEQRLGSFLPDGRSLVFDQTGGPTATDLMVLRFDPKPHVDALLQTPFVEASGTVSPDGRWIAYYGNENESGRSQVYVRPFPKVDSARSQISTARGSRPAWSRDGHELFYLDGSTAMMAVPVQTEGGVFHAGNASKLFDGPWYAVSSTRPYDVTRDGKRFLMIGNPGTDDPRLVYPTMTVVVNWIEELKQRVPTR
jgi:serine/threonine protein kinase/Tol biopolymer transport system component